MEIGIAPQSRKTGWKHRRHLRLRLGLCERYVVDLLLAVLKESIEGSATFAERKATMNAVVAGLARVQGPYVVASRSLSTPATGNT